jgi:hypothetical protein
MTYTPEEKNRMDTIFTAFQDYISPHQCFDILYLQKRGYLHLTLEKEFVETEDIVDADHLFRLLMMEILNDVQDLHMCGEHLTGEIFPCEVDEALRRANEYIERLPAELRDYYSTALQVCFKNPILEE